MEPWLSRYEIHADKLEVRSVGSCQGMPPTQLLIGDIKLISVKLQVSLWSVRSQVMSTFHLTTLYDKTKDY